ncbi:polysaccharide lyase [Echinicola jeungdonensis]|uniref:Polysaccharide lyase family 1 protein n=1 Tax=Echinicola jeungdonensis TaxID=709343 RepID=A0ABV5J3U0_9BACT|nr:polysaccharide lyase [Echinicola jeungdonensis]MDN3669328.1 polysaccharide lyase [Echinicola jeungdonensis]
MFKKKFNYLFYLLFFVTPLTLKAQYPEIPPEVEKEAEKINAANEKHSEQAWEKAWPVIKAEIKEGKPYLPWASTPGDLPQADIPAFPGAEGGGAYSFGGRGGKVFVVTSLADRGPGTFREACEAGGARYIVFNVAGIIQLESPINIRAPYVTIAGQTAPGDGVCIAGATVSIDTHDVVIRHMRFRRGETDVRFRDDALGGNGVGNIIIDHVSSTWGLDENMSMYRHMYEAGDGKRHKLPTVNVTIQNSIFAEALDTYNHSFGSTIGGLNSTFMRNLWASNIARNASVGMYGDFGFVNNVIFNWWYRTIDGGDHRSRYNILNNYFKPGPITPKDDPVGFRIIKPEGDRSVKDSLVLGRLHVSGNIMEGYEEINKDNWNGGVQVDGKPELTKKFEPYIRVNEPFPLAQLSMMTAEEAYDFVLENVGATLPKRDPVDSRIVRQVKTGKIEYQEGGKSHIGKEFLVGGRRRLDEDSYNKGIITDVSQVGGYPEYNGVPYQDSDKDGMPDDWEKDHGLNPNYPADANGDLNGDGYDNIEKYIHAIPTDKVVDWTKVGNNYDTLSKKYR